jgi:hypothetical protein
MATIKTIYPYIKPYASGIPEPAIDAEAVALAKMLAQKTLTLRDTVYIPSQANWGTYEIEFAEGQQLEVVTSVCVNGVRVDALNSKPCDGCNDRGFWIDRNKSISIYPPPSESREDGIEIEYAFSPSLSSCEIDSDFLEKYGFDIAHGVLGRVLMMKDQKWYNPQLAARYEQSWRSAMSSALVDGNTPFTRANISMPSGYSYLNS